MALYKYFKKSSILTNPDGSLSDQVTFSAIISANNEVQMMVIKPSDSSSSGKRGHYSTYTDE